MNDTQRDWITGLRDMADWFEQHPDRIPPYLPVTVNLFADDRDDLIAYAREFGKADKSVVNDWFALRKRFGPHAIDANLPREEICRKVVTGTRQVPAQMIEAREEEIVEWVCEDALLAAKPEAVA